MTSSSSSVRWAQSGRRSRLQPVTPITHLGTFPRALCSSRFGHVLAVACLRLVLITDLKGNRLSEPSTSSLKPPSPSRTKALMHSSSILTSREIREEKDKITINTLRLFYFSNQKTSGGREASHPACTLSMGVSLERWEKKTVASKNTFSTQSNGSFYREQLRPVFASSNKRTSTTLNL